jgi:hypothetical protein
MNLFLALLPSLIGLVIFLWYITPEQIALVLVVLKWASIGIGGYVLLWLFRGAPEPEPDYIYPDFGDHPIDYRYLIIRKVDNHTVSIEDRRSGGKWLLEKDQNNLAYFQEVDKNNNPIGYKVRGAPNAWQFGRTVNQDLAHFLRQQINSKRSNQ